MPAKGSGIQEDAFLAAVIEANTSPMSVDWNKVASLIHYGSAKSASTRFGIIRKRWGITKTNKPTHVGTHAEKVTKTRAPAKPAAIRASRAKPAGPNEKSLGKVCVGGKAKKHPQKVEDDEHDEKSGQGEDIKDLMATSDDEQQEAEFVATRAEKPVRNLMVPFDEEEEEQESFQSQVSRGLYAVSDVEEDDASLCDGEIELLNLQIAQQQEVQLRAQMQQ